MKKRLSIILVVILVCVLAGCAGDVESYQALPSQSDWMSMISDDANITKIAIPGTHDSGTVGMMSNACTQGVSIGEQMKLGARYFDIRVSGNRDGGKIFHGPIKGTAFPPIMKDIALFIKEHPSEFLILDFQHFAKNGEDNVLVEIENSGVIDYALTRPAGTTDDATFINSLTLKDVRGKVIIFFGGDRDIDLPYVFRRNNDGCTLEGRALDSLYTSELNKKKSEEYISEAMPKYLDHIVNNRHGIMVLQGQLTSPNFGNLYKLEKKHDSNMTAFVDSIKDNKTYLDNVGVIMRDFYENNSEKCMSVLRLNYYKGIVKDSSIDEYMSMTNIEK